MPVSLSGSALPQAAEEAQTKPALPVDPLRLLGGLRLRLRWVMLGACAGLGLGLALGICKAKTRYEVSIQLLERDSPTSFQVGTDGHPYLPREFTSSTLASAATSLSVLQRVAERAKPAVGVGLLKISCKVAEEKKTDFLTLTLSAYTSAQATADLINIWAEEVVNFPKEMQARESREICDALEGQLARNQAELESLDQKSLSAPREEVQIDTYRHSQGEVEMKYESARIDLESTDSQLETLRNALLQQSPLAAALREARTDLEQLRSRYTEENPLVLEKRDKVAALEEQIKKDSAGASNDLSKFAGTEVGNHLYMKIVELQNEREAIKRRMDDLTQLRKASQETPGAYGLTELARKKQTLETAQILLLNRLQEMRLFEQNAQGMYRILAPATADEVAHKGKLLKVAIFTLAGVFAGVAGAVSAAVLMELLDARLRTTNEATKAFGAPALVSIPVDCASAKKMELGAKLWLRWIRDRSDAGRVVWSPVKDADEEEFWSILLAEAVKFSPSLLIVDCGAAPSPSLAALPRISGGSAPAVASERWTVDQFNHAEMQRACAELERYRARGREVWLRFTGEVQEPASTLARAAGGRPLVLVALHSQTMRFWREQAELLRHSVGELCGIVPLKEWPAFLLG